LECGGSPPLFLRLSNLSSTSEFHVKPLEATLRKMAQNDASNSFRMTLTKNIGGGPVIVNYKSLWSAAVYP
jgi:hypothetical protein